jgi:hypothetical protein
MAVAWLTGGRMAWLRVDASPLLAPLRSELVALLAARHWPVAAPSVRIAGSPGIAVIAGG